MAANKKFLSRNKYMLKGSLKRKGYDWWWHSFTGYNVRTGEAKAFFIEYFIINPSRSPKEPVFGQLNEDMFDVGYTVPNRPSYVMIKAGCWGKDAKQIHNFYPTSEFKIHKRPFGISVGKSGFNPKNEKQRKNQFDWIQFEKNAKNCVLSESTLFGSVSLSESEAVRHPEYMSDYGSMSWELKLEKQITFNPGYATSWFFRKLNPFQMYWHAQGVKTEYSGTVQLDGEVYRVAPESSFGYADKNWGSGFTVPWVWISSCNLVSQISRKRLANSAFDIGGGCPRVFGIPLKRKLLVFLKLEGKTFEFNFSKFWKRSKVTFNFIEGDEVLHWFVSASNGKYLLDLDAYCPKDETLFVNYENPMGVKTFERLWNGGTGYGNFKLFKKKGKTIELLEDVAMQNVGLEYGEN